MVSITLFNIYTLQGDPFSGKGSFKSALSSDPFGGDVFGDDATSNNQTWFSSSTQSDGFGSTQLGLGTGGSASNPNEKESIYLF